MLTDEQRACIAWRCEHPKTGEDHRMVEISLGTLRTLLSAHADAVRLREALTAESERLFRIIQGCECVGRGFCEAYGCGTIAEIRANIEAALRPAEQGGGDAKLCYPFAANTCDRPGCSCRRDKADDIAAAEQGGGA